MKVYAHLGNLDGQPTNALALNEAGWVVGLANTTTTATRAFLWTPVDGMRNLGTPDDVGTSLATDVNDAGQVVGYRSTTSSKLHAFLWTETDGMEDIFPMTGMASAAAINNRGQVVGDGRVATLQFLTQPRSGSERGRTLFGHRGARVAFCG